MGIGNIAICRPVGGLNTADLVFGRLANFSIADCNWLTYFKSDTCDLFGFCYVMLFSWKFDPHTPPRNANNIELFTFVMRFLGKADTTTPHCIT